MKENKSVHLLFLLLLFTSACATTATPAPVQTNVSVPTPIQTLVPTSTAAIPSTHTPVPPLLTPFTRTSPEIPPTSRGTAVSGPTATPSLQVNILDLNDGGNITASLDKNGVPVARISAEVRGGATAATVLIVDGIAVAIAPNTAKANPFRAELAWWPRRTGAHTLVVAAGNPSIPWTLGALATKKVVVNVTSVPTPPVTQKIIDLYKEKFGLVLTRPALARWESQNPAESHWVSAAYVGNAAYAINLFDDSRVTTSIWAINDPIKQDPSALCRPAGRYRLLVVFVDYGNTGITKEAALAAIPEISAGLNAYPAQFAVERGLKAPILQFDLTGAYISPPPKPGDPVTPYQVKTLTGSDPAQFDLLVQIDLDNENAFGKKFGNAGLMGSFWGGCTGRGVRHINVWVGINATNTQPRTLVLRAVGELNHELGHAMGWQHTWPCGDGSSLTIVIGQVCDPPQTTLLFGWEDLDGDGLPEILQPKPYGMR